MLYAAPWPPSSRTAGIGPTVEALLSSTLGIPLQEVVESSLGVVGGNNISSEASLVTNVAEQLFGILQDLCFMLSSGKADSWVTITICNGCGGGVASASLSTFMGVGA